LTCDGYIAELSAAVSPRTGYPGPLHGLDFSQTYNCSSSSDVGNNNNNSNYNATGVGRRLRETWYKFSGRRLRETWYKLRRWLAGNNNNNNNNNAAPSPGNNNNNYNAAPSPGSSYDNDEIKQYINEVTSTSGCCGGNSGAPRSACWTAPRECNFLVLF